MQLPNARPLLFHQRFTESSAHLKILSRHNNGTALLDMPMAADPRSSSI